MIVVSDASPLHYLILVDADSVLPILFGEVFVPPAVIAELQNPRTPPRVFRFIEKRPAWMIVRAPIRVDTSLILDRGELEAIALAEELQATTLLIDELAGRRLAKARGFRVTGTLGVLELSAARGLISLPPAIEKLRRTDYRISASIIDDALRRDEQRHTGP